MRIVFFGTPKFAAYNLEKILEAGFQVVGVVTAADKPAGRGRHLQESEVKKVALNHGIKILQPTNMKSERFVTELQELKADLQVVIAFRMMPEVVWSMPRLGTFNLHASLLPNYRGAAPINHVLINGENKTGVTTFFLKHEIDTGDIAFQEEVAISPTDDFGTLHDKLMVKGAELVVKTLSHLQNGTLTTYPQMLNDGSYYAHKLTKEFCQLDLEATAKSAHQKIRGLSPFPGAWVKMKDGSTCKILTSIESTLPSNAIEKETWYVKDKKLYLPFSDYLLEIIDLQPENRSKMKAVDFINGLTSKKKQ